MEKSAEAFRTISEVAEDLDLPQHVLRFWETRFSQIKPLKRAGGRRFYRPHDIEVLRAIKRLLYAEGYTIKGVQRLLKEQGARAIVAASYAVSEVGSDPAQNRWEDSGLAAVEAAWTRDEIGPAFESRPRDIELASSRRTEIGSEHSGANAEARNIPGPEPVWPSSLLVEDATRLQAAVAELEECERILWAVRRV